MYVLKADTETQETISPDPHFCPILPLGKVQQLPQAGDFSCVLKGQLLVSCINCLWETESGRAPVQKCLLLQQTVLHMTRLLIHYVKDSLPEGPNHHTTVCAHFCNKILPFMIICLCPRRARCTCEVFCIKSQNNWSGLCSGVEDAVCCFTWSSKIAWATLAAAQL